MKFIQLFLISGFILCLFNDGEATKCSNSYGIMDCRRMGKEFPKPHEVPNGVTSILMDENGIEKLKLIPEIQTLRRLSLSHNNISEIEFDAFDNAHELTSLDLSFNRISMLADDIFELNPEKLQILFLNDNKLEYVKKLLFNDLNELTELYLQNNKITFIHNRALHQLKKLRILRLDGNQLHTFQSKWIKKLQSNNFVTMRFDNNLWACDCEMKNTVKWLTSARGAWFKNLQSAHPLTCAQPALLLNQRIDAINSSKLTACNKPLIIEISKSATIREGKSVLLECRIATGDEFLPLPIVYWTAPNREFFAGTKLFQNGSLLIPNFSSADVGLYLCTAQNSQGSYRVNCTLTLDKTQSANPVDESIFSKQTTQNMHVQENSQVTISTNQNCSNNCKCFANNINCGGYSSIKRTKFPDDIPETAQTINLANNKLTHLSENQFIRFADLEEIRLDNNDIHTIDVNAFRGLSKVTTLTMRDNQITAIQDGTFKDMTRLNVLVLDNNFIQNISRAMFEGLENLNWLYVRNNHIRVIEESAFVNLLLIKFIHLEGNELTSFSLTHVNDLLTMPNLQKIFFVEDMLECDNIKTFNTSMEAIGNDLGCIAFNEPHVSG